jgi:hypothetical protein
MLIRQIGLLKLLAMHYNDDGVLIQSLESPREIPVRPSAEQAVKVPLQPLQGSGDSAKRDDTSVSSIFTCQYSDFTRSESQAAKAVPPRMTEGSTVHISALMHRDDSKIRKF